MLWSGYLLPSDLLKVLCTTETLAEWLHIADAVRQKNSKKKKPETQETAE